VQVAGAKAGELRAAGHAPRLAIHRVGTHTGVVFSGKTFELFATSLADRSWRARRLILVGAGSAVQPAP